MLCHHPNHTQFSYCKILCFFRCMLYSPTPFPTPAPKHKTDLEQDGLHHRRHLQRFITAHKRSLGQGNIFTSMGHSFCPQVGGLASQYASQITWLGVSASRGRICIQGGWADPPQHYGIWSISARHASYRNAFLFHMWLILIRMQFLNNSPWITSSRETEHVQICNKWVNLIGNKVNSIMNWAGVELVPTMHQNYGKAITTFSSIVLYCSYHFDHILPRTTCQTHYINFSCF